MPKRLSDGVNGPAFLARPLFAAFRFQARRAGLASAARRIGSMRRRAAACGSAAGVTVRHKRAGFASPTP